MLLEDELALSREADTHRLLTEANVEVYPSALPVAAFMPATVCDSRECSACRTHTPYPISADLFICRTAGVCFGMIPQQSRLSMSRPRWSALSWGPRAFGGEGGGGKKGWFTPQLIQQAVKWMPSAVSGTPKRGRKQKSYTIPCRLGVPTLGEAVARRSRSSGTVLDPEAHGGPCEPGFLWDDLGGLSGGLSCRGPKTRTPRVHTDLVFAHAHAHAQAATERAYAILRRPKQRRASLCDRRRHRWRWCRPAHARTGTGSDGKRCNPPCNLLCVGGALG